MGIKIYVSIMIFLKDINDLNFKIWTQVRDEAGPLYGKLEFPGGKIELNETPDQAVVREVQEEVGIEILNTSRRKLFKIQEYFFNDKNIVLYAFISDFDQLPIAAGSWLEIDYLTKSKYLEDKIPKINHVIIDELAVYLKKMHSENLLEILWTKSR